MALAPVKTATEVFTELADRIEPQLLMPSPYGTGRTARLSPVGVRGSDTATPDAVYLQSAYRSTGAEGDEAGASLDNQQGEWTAVLNSLDVDSGAGGCGEGAEGVGFRGNPWKSVGGGDGLGTKWFAGVKMLGGAGVGLEGEGREGGEGGGAACTNGNAEGIDGVDWVGTKGGGGKGDGTAAGSRLHVDDGEVRVSAGDGGEEVQRDIAGDEAGDGRSAMGDDGGNPVGDGGCNAVRGDGEKAVWGDGEDVVGNDGGDAKEIGVGVDGAVRRGSDAGKDGA